MNMRSLKFILLLCLLTVLLVVSYSAKQDSGPKVNGHPLGFWLKKLVGKSNSASDMRDAEQAVRLAGTNAVPYLIAQLSAVEKAKAERSGKIPDLGEAIYLSGGAVAALEILGNSIEPSIPELARLMNSESPETVGNASRVLSGLGPSGAETILSGLTNRNPEARVAAAKWLGHTGTNLVGKVPFLLTSLDHLDDRTASECCFGLVFNYANLPNLVPELVNHLASTNAATRCLIATGLGFMGTNALESIPALQGLASDPSQHVRDAAKDALSRIRRNRD